MNQKLLSGNKRVKSIKGSFNSYLFLMALNGKLQGQFNNFYIKK